MSIQTYFDEWVAYKKKEQKKKVSASRAARPARFIRLSPAGFPLKDAQKGYYINVKDGKLFEIYVREQWIGTAVSKGDYLFDQRMIPDFAFQVIKTSPAGGVLITENTIIELEVPPRNCFAVTSRVSFADIIGHENVKNKSKIIVKYLKDPSSFGEWAPRNVLFYGQPGTGKTMAAKALAAETESALYLVRATDLIGEYVGEGSRRIHELFENARESAPSIIFIDELDAIGLDRAYQSVRGDVSEVVNALLTELEGIYENKSVVTIAATNTPTALDAALRSRFEEEIEFKLPNAKERLEMLRTYAGRFPLKISMNLKEYVKRTEGFSGRDIKDKLLKTALHKAIAEDAEEVSDAHLEFALREIPGRSKPPKEMFS